MVDRDGDGVGGTEEWSCVAPPDAADAVGDCDDGDPTVYPGVVDVCDGIDNDCDGIIDPDAQTWFTDADGDGFGDAALPVPVCDDTSGASDNAEDCDDGDAAVHPGADEVWYDGIDQDCGDDDDFDQDGDGYRAGDVGGDDCDDDAFGVNPGVEEVCNDGVDNDCNPSTTCPLSGVIAADEMDAVAALDDEGVDYFGQFVSYVGDVDSDGVGEFAWTYRHESGLDGDTDGRVSSIVLARGTTADGALRQDDWASQREDVGAFRPAGSGEVDVDMDGVEDLLIFRTFTGTGTTQEDGVYVYPGPVYDVIEPDSWATRVTGEAQQIRPGGSWVALARSSEARIAYADNNAYSPSGGRPAVGGVFVFPLVELAGESQTTDAAEAAIWGEGAYEQVGDSATWADLNGDGFDDLLVSRGGNPEGVGGWAPETGIFVGPLSGPTAFADHDGSIRDEVSVSGLDRRGLGRFGAIRADLDGDGRDDLFVGHGWYDDGTGDRGRAFGFISDEDGVGDRTTEDASVDLIMAHGMYSGSFRVGVGDLDCDGGIEVMLGEPSDPTLGGPGQVLGFSLPLPSGTHLVEDADVTWFSPSDEDEFGAYFALGDINADGCDDIAISALGYPGGADVGAVFFSFGRGL